MSLQHCLPSELDIFGHKAIQIGIIDSGEIEYQNVNSLDNASIIEFNVVNPSTDTYLDLSTVALNMQFRAVKENGVRYKEVTEGANKADEKKDQPSSINNMLSSLIKSANVYINNILVSSCPLYCFKSYIDTVLNYGNDAVNTHLVMAGFLRDDNGEFDDSTDTNSGAKARRNLMYNSATVNLYGKLDMDIFSTPHLLLNGMDLKIVLTLNSDEFFFFETKKSKFVIQKASVSVKQCKINHNILLQHHKLLSSKKAHYSYSRSNLRTFTIPTGIQSIQIDNIVNGILPTSLVFGFIDNDAFNGTRESNPYNFKAMDLQSFSLFVNGIPLAGHPIIIEQYGATKFMHAYRSLYQNLQALYKDSGTLTYDQFKGGSFLLPISLLPSENGGSVCTPMLKQGTIKVDLKFYTAPANTITMLVYMETPSMFVIDQHRNVSLLG